MRNKLTTLAVLFVLGIFGSAQANVASDDLSRCLIDKSKQQDQVVLVRWMFAALSTHPSVGDMTKVDAAKLTSANKEMAALVQDMLVNRCVKEARSAVKANGAQSLGASFQLFGQSAARGLLTNPQVAKNIAQLGNYVDDKKLQKALGLPK